MKKGSLTTPTTDLVSGRSMKSATPGMGTDGDSAGVSIKQMEGVSVGSPKLTTPAKDKVDNGSKSASSMGAKVGKSVSLTTPTTSVVK